MTARLLGILMLWTAAAAAAAAPAQDKPDAAAQAAVAVGHLMTQRPEGIVLVALSTAKREPQMTALDFLALDPHVQGSIGATTLVGVRSAPMVLALHRHGMNNGVWIIEGPGVTRRPREPELDRQKLVGIEDGKYIPAYKDNPDEHNSYLYTIAHAHDVPLDALAKAARKDLTYAHLLEQPARYRGEVVHIVGRLKQLRKFDAPRGVWNDGIRVMYEALIASDSHYNSRYYVILTEVPPGLKLGDNLDYPVSTDAYYFKRYFLENIKDGTKHRAPLLIGRSVTVLPAPAVDEAVVDFSLWPATPIVMVVMGLTAMAILIGVILYWFSKGDKAVQSRLSGSRTAEWTEPSTEGSAADPSGVSGPK